MASDDRAEYDREDGHSGSWWLFFATIGVIAVIFYAVGLDLPPAAETLMRSNPETLDSAKLAAGAFQLVVGAISFGLLYDFAVRFSGVPLPKIVLSNSGDTDE